MHGLRPTPVVASLVLAAALALRPSDASACGGCFHEANTTQTTVVTGHRMAFAVSPTHAVLWDQIKYAGTPGDFAWVLPVKGGAYLEISHDAWFETLDAATSAQIVAPIVNCPPVFGGGPVGGGSFGGGCCGSSASAEFGGAAGGFGTTGSGGPPQPPPVSVTHEGTVGPYDTVTLHANVPNALPSWLTSHNYAIDPSVAPIIDAYAAEGFDFIALRLQPGEGVQQMKPVRVITPGMSFSLPLRMVAAGTGADVALTLFVVGEGRWEAQNFPNGQVDPNSLTWDFLFQSSDYTTQRQALLKTNNGRTWNSAFSNQGSLLSQDTIGGIPTSITVGGQPYPTFATAYVAQGEADGEAPPGTSSTCDLNAYSTSTDQVVDCSTGTGMDAGTGGSDGGLGSDGGAADGGADGGGGSSAPPCSGLPPDQIPSSAFACGPLDDLAVALVGLHPGDVWLTRLEADLPRAALATDLVLQASASQTQVSNVFNVTKSKNSPCPSAAAGITSDGPSPWLRNKLAVFAVALAAIAAAVARRRRPLALPAA